MKYSNYWYSYFIFLLSSPLSVHETKSLDVGRSKPVNMPTTTTYPILIESGSVSSCDQSPKLQDTYQHTVVEPGGAGEVQLKEDLAEAMLESPGVREAGWSYYFFRQLFSSLFVHLNMTMREAGLYCYT